LVSSWRGFFCIAGCDARVEREPENGYGLAFLNFNMLTRCFLCLIGILAILWKPAMAAVELPYRNEASRQLLLRALEDEDRIQRSRAATIFTLNVKGGPGEAALSKLATDPVPAVRRAAETNPFAAKELPPANMAGAWRELALKQGFKPRPIVEETAMSDSHRDPRIRQIVRLRKLASDPAWKENFSDALKDPDYFVRQAVTTEVVKTRGAASLPVWRKLVAGGWLDGQIEAVRAIGQLESKADEPLLLPLLNATSERLRLTTVDSLWRMGGDATRQVLGETISKHTGRTQERLLELAAQIKALPALPVIRKLAGDKKQPQQVQVLALDALKALVDQEAKPLLLKIIMDYDYMYGFGRQHAAQALGVLGATEAIPHLQRLVTEKAIPVPMMGPSYDMDPTRIASVNALQQLNAVNELRGMVSAPFLKEASEDLRRALAAALTKATGTTYDYQRSVITPSYFVESLTPIEYPPDLAENLKKPPLFTVP
jgi:HEAT repeat protein